ncbi:MAG: hypothetical protein ACTS27_05670 [Phycisphaerales bacterium]
MSAGTPLRAFKPQVGDSAVRVRAASHQQKEHTMIRARSMFTTLTLLVSGLACGAPGAPNDFEQSDESLNRLFAYFGGVAFWETMVTPRHVYSGNSLQVDIGFQPDAFFPISGAAIGTSTISGAALNVPANAQVVSVTVDWPHAATLGMEIHVREDDDGSGVIEAGEDDDWVSPQVFLEPGVNVYNFAFSEFIDDNPDVGDGVQQFATTGAMQYYFVFETRASFPGGRIETPVTFYADHFGFYHEAQALGPAGVPGDTNGDGVVNFADLNTVLTQFGMTGAGLAGDVTADGLVNFADLNTVLSNFGSFGS